MAKKLSDIITEAIEENTSADGRLLVSAEYITAKVLQEIENSDTIEDSPEFALPALDSIRDKIDERIPLIKEMLNKLADADQTEIAEMVGLINQGNENSADYWRTIGEKLEAIAESDEEKETATLLSYFGDALDFVNETTSLTLDSLYGENEEDDEEPEGEKGFPKLSVPITKQVIKVVNGTGI